MMEKVGIQMRYVCRDCDKRFKAADDSAPQDVRDQCDRHTDRQAH